MGSCIEKFYEGVSSPFYQSALMLEEATLPFSEEEDSCAERILGIAKRCIIFIGAIIGLVLSAPVAFVSWSIKSIVHLFPTKEVTLEQRVNKLLKNFMSIRLPDLRGSSICEYQASGMDNCPDSDWAAFEMSVNSRGKPTIPPKNRSYKGFDLWNKPDRFISQAKAMGMNHLRFSVEWSKIEPKEGEFNEEALEHYVEFCQKLLKAGIEPMVSLLHFSMPKWFADKGGFEKSENIQHFVQFSIQVFERLKSYVPKWCTINEPAIQSFCGHVIGTFPPAKSDIPLSGKVLYNLLQAHKRVYTAIKACEGGQEAKVGFTHNYLKFFAYHEWNLLEHLPARYLSMMTNDVVLRYLETGEFNYQMPFVVNMQKRDVKPLKDYLDFIGVNFYARVPLVQQCAFRMLSPTYMPGEEMTKMEYPTDPLGMHEAVSVLHKVTGMPVYILETGISAVNDKQAARFYKRVIAVVHCAMIDGIPIELLDLWALIKNFEWAEGWDPQNFGLIDYDRKNDRFTFRQGAEPVAKLFQKKAQVA